MRDNSVFSFQAELHLPLSDNFLCIWRQSLGVPGEHKGVAVSTSAICIELAAGVMKGICVIICVHYPVIIIWKKP